MSKLSRFIHKHQLALRKRAWQIMRNYESPAKCVFILGAQRSGTTMLIRSLNESMELEVHGEASARAMNNWRLRDLDTVRDIVESSRARVVIFKPLTESHRARELLSGFPQSVVCWAFRRAADRANSSVARFGPHNLEYLSAFVRGELLDSWQAQGLSSESLDLIKSFDYSDMTPHSASALFWYVRNILFFEQGLDDDSRVLPIAYEDVVADPQTVFLGLCRFFGCNYSPALTARIHAKSVGKTESRVAPDIERLCDTLYDRLHTVQRARWSALESTAGERPETTIGARS